MRKFYLLLVSLFVSLAGNSGTLRAQFRGDIRMTCKRLDVDRDDSLRLEFEFLIRNRAVNTCQSWTFVPELSTADGKNFRYFPRVVINGRNRRRMTDRRNRLTRRFWSEEQPYQTVNVADEEQTLVDYAAAVPYEEWMGGASLKLQEVLASCGGKRQLLTVALGDRIAFPALEPYVPQVSVVYCEPGPESKQRLVKGEAFLDFQVGRSAILPDFRHNGEELGKIRAVIDRIRRDGDGEITDIFIEGYASPEGNAERNAGLSLARAKALKDYLQRAYALPEGIFRVSSVGEDWSGLRQLVEESDLPDRERVLRIIDGPLTPDGKEQALRATGRTWQRLLTDIFPQLRHVDYQVRYDLRDYTFEESLSVAEHAPEKLSQMELYRIAVSYASDSARYHGFFDRILELYPDDPAANINAAASLLQRGDAAAAERCLDHAAGAIAAPDAAMASAFANNRGAALLLENRLDEAEPLLRRAADAGRAEARRNLEELERKRGDNARLERYRNISQ